MKKIRGKLDYRRNIISDLKRSVSAQETPNGTFNARTLANAPNESDYWLVS